MKESSSPVGFGGTGNGKRETRNEKERRGEEVGWVREQEDIWG